MQLNVTCDHEGFYGIHYNFLLSNYNFSHKNIFSITHMN